MMKYRITNPIYMEGRADEIVIALAEKQRFHESSGPIDLDAYITKQTAFLRKLGHRIEDITPELPTPLRAGFFLRRLRAAGLISIEEVTEPMVPATPKTYLYAAYDSNLCPAQMAHRCPTASVIGKAVLKDYELTFRGGVCAMATVEPKKGASVPVLIWEILPMDLRSLDSCELKLYRREVMDVGKFKDVIIYIMNSNLAYGEPTREYFGSIYDGYESAGFDTKILHEARKKAQQAWYEQMHIREVTEHGKTTRIPRQTAQSPRGKKVPNDRLYIGTAH